MARNTVQFQKGLSEAQFAVLYGTEDQCRDAVMRAREPPTPALGLAERGVARRLHAILAGQAAPLIRELPAGQLVDRLVAEARAILGASA